ncbi:oxidoreductase activity protein [Scheffersomyces coipomensis]|uniref:oxidoreductase activity protein n=1 Tax=Scheffersomyces coipomensis TaxID=1788519 RepID=UPI00315E0141
MAPVQYIRTPPSIYSRVQYDNEEEGILTVAKEFIAKSSVPDFLPTWNKNEKYEPLKFYEHHDVGFKADASFPNLLPKDTVTTKNITPKLELNDAAKDELALFVAQKGLVVFRDQDIASKGPKFSADFGRYFGPLHIHPTSGAPRTSTELHVVYRRPDVKDIYENRTNLVQWHSDVSYELQPPGTTFFTVVEGPESGGDTLFADAVEAYNHLSPALQKRLEGLHAIHSGVSQALTSRRGGGLVKREPVENVHPLVRTHPVTGDKALFVNSGFTRKIVELKEDESDYLLNFLYDHLNNSHDLQARANWLPGTVAVWDNRRVNHSALLDWEGGSSRLAYRITPTAERPVYDLKDLNAPDVNRVFVGNDYTPSD